MPELLANQLGTLGNRIFSDLHGLFDLSTAGVLRMLKSSTGDMEIGEVASRLGMPPERGAEFAELWETTFGSTTLDALIRFQPKANEESVERPSDGEEPANSKEGDQNSEPDDAELDGDADSEGWAMPAEVSAFIFQHGSMDALISIIRGISRQAIHVRTLTHSVIVFAVGALESALAGISRTRFQMHPGSMRAEEPEFSVADLVRLSDLADLIDEAVERRVDAICHGNLEMWSKWYQEAFREDLQEMALNWDGVQEMVQRRHIIVHNNGIASRLYARRLGLNEEIVGERPPVTLEYLLQTIDECIVLSMRMVATAWGKLARDDHETIAGFLNDLAFQLLQLQRWAAASALATDARKFADQGAVSDLIAQVNGWIARREMGQEDDVSEAVAAWNVSALDARFRVAKVALQGDLDGLRKHLPVAVDARTITLAQVNTWPLFRRLREDSEFGALLQDIAADEREDVSGGPRSA